MQHDRIVFKKDVKSEHRRILTPKALDFLCELHDKFDSKIEHELNKRQEKKRNKEEPDFLENTQEIRESDWRVAELPKTLLKRHIEITGPVERKMIINALNSGADMFMADCEDSSAPNWENMIEGQINLADAVRRKIRFVNEKTKKEYKLNDKTAMLLVRPRGLHLLEENLLIGNKPIRGSLFDFGLYFFHNAKELLANGAGPYFYLPKLESHLEARIWNDIFNFSQDSLDIPRKSIKATVLIETLPAAFELDEILWELKDHSSGLNCGRWDYIFSYIKTFQHDANKVLPDRSQVNMLQHFMRSYSQRLIKVCHKRGVHAMGGMAAQIPIKNDDAANDAAMEKVREDKLREVKDGHDGTWVAHPGLIPIVRDIFSSNLKTDNQIDSTKKNQDYLQWLEVTREDLTQTPEGTKTLNGLRENICVGIQYLAAWMSGQGCVPLYNLMEDAATAEISRSQVWQWLKYGVSLDSGETVDENLIKSITAEQMDRIKYEVGEGHFADGRYEEAAKLFTDLTYADELADFCTLAAYHKLND